MIGKVAIAALIRQAVVIATNANPFDFSASQNTTMSGEVITICAWSNQASISTQRAKHAEFKPTKS